MKNHPSLTKIKHMKYTYPAILLLALASCRSNGDAHDAQGTFEADEIMVSAEVGGRLTAFTVEEGDTLSAGQVVGQIDDRNLGLQREQVEASLRSLEERTTDVTPQIKLLNEQLQVQQTQLRNLQKEYERMSGLLRKDAATARQVDEIGYQIETLEKQTEVTRQQMSVARAETNLRNRSVLSEQAPLRKRAEQIEDMRLRSAITNPVRGTVITSFAEPGEMAMPGKPLYKIADLSELILRAYVTGDQLPNLKIGQSVKVFTDKDSDAYDEHAGVIRWISPKAEFTPKTIQTKDERANLVYAIKVRVKNNGTLKIGMYAEIGF
jgi:HlyD family secretion protein